MISLAFDYKGNISKQNNNTISGGTNKTLTFEQLMSGEGQLPDDTILISSVSFSWLKRNVPGFIKGRDSEYGEYGYVLTSKYRHKIKVFTTGDDNQWSSFTAFQYLKEELGNKYKPYDPIDHDVYLVPLD